MALPKMRTQEDVAREQTEIFKNGSERDRALLWISALTGSGERGLPTTDDHNKIVRDAVSDFGNSNFSEARSAVESLSLIVDFYRELAQKYLDALTSLGAVTDEYGDVTRDPFVMLDADGEQKLGAVEVLQYDGEDQGTWNYYIEPYLPFASESEKTWIVEHYGRFMGADVEPAPEVPGLEGTRAELADLIDIRKADS